ncbi:AAA family ATPase [Candidatus Peregrinibacteria bacterium]|jgi:AAA+ superfamily predicted ATPase|nr:AAA family ATPase [Candidatus Peregrinibacteria bacterium]
MKATLDIDGLGPDIVAELEQVCSDDLDEFPIVAEWRDRCAEWRAQDFDIDALGGVDCRQDPLKYYFDPEFAGIRASQKQGLRSDHLLSALSELSDFDPGLCIKGDTSDLFPISDSEGRTHFCDLKDITAEAAEYSGKYDTVIIYDAATCSFSFADELSIGLGNKEGAAEAQEPDEEGGQRDDFLNLAVEVKDRGGENLVPSLLTKGTIRDTYGSMSDKVMIEMLKQAIAKEGQKICLIIDNADLFLPKGAESGPSASMERYNNEGITLAFHSFLRTHSGSSMVLIDRNNVINGGVSKVFTTTKIGTPTRAEIEGQLKRLDLDVAVFHEALKEAKGLSLRALVRLMRSSTKEQFLADLKQQKLVEATTRSEGAVTCEEKHYTDEMISMSEAERKFLKDIAVAFHEKRDLLPQAISFIGPPGTGKSVRANYLASLMGGVPVLKLGNVSSGGLRGKKEDRYRAAIEAAKRLAPCVLCIDELEKIFPNTEKTGNKSNDDDEVIAYLQSEIGSKGMQGVVIIGTSNHPQNLDTAMLRNGRFGLCVAVLPPQTLDEKLDLFAAVKSQFESLNEVEIPLDLIMKILEMDNLRGTAGNDYYELLRLAALKWHLSADGDFIEALKEMAVLFRRQEVKAGEEAAMIETAIKMHSAPFALDFGAQREASEIPELPGEAAPILAELEELRDIWRNRGAAEVTATKPTEKGIPADARDAELAALKAELIAIRAAIEPYKAKLRESFLEGQEAVLAGIDAEVEQRRLEGERVLAGVRKQVKWCLTRIANLDRETEATKAASLNKSLNSARRKALDNIRKLEAELQEISERLNALVRSDVGKAVDVPSMRDQVVKLGRAIEEVTARRIMNLDWLRPGYIGEYPYDIIQLKNWKPSLSKVDVRSRMHSRLRHGDIVTVTREYDCHDGFGIRPGQRFFFEGFNIAGKGMFLTALDGSKQLHHLEMKKHLKGDWADGFEVVRWWGEYDPAEYSEVLTIGTDATRYKAMSVGDYQPTENGFPYTSTHLVDHSEWRTYKLGQVDESYGFGCGDIITTRGEFFTGRRGIILGQYEDKIWVGLVCNRSDDRGGGPLSAWNMGKDVSTSLVAKWGEYDPAELSFNPHTDLWRFAHVTQSKDVLKDWPASEAELVRQALERLGEA